MESHKETVSKMDELQDQIKNDKIRQYIQQKHRGSDSELRVGIAAPGNDDDIFGDDSEDYCML